MPLRPDTGRAIATLVTLGMVVVAGCGGSVSSDYKVIDQKTAHQRVAVPNVEAQPDAVAIGSELQPVAASPVNSLEDEKGITAPVQPESTIVPSDAPSLTVGTPKPGKIELLIPEKSFPRDRKSGALRITYDDLNLLKVLNMDPVTDDAVSHMPGWMTGLEGQTVRVRGYMYPNQFEDRLEMFVLLRDNQECCFGPTAKIYDHIVIRMREGTTAKFVDKNVVLDIVGRFKIQLESAGGEIFGLYIIEDAAVVGR